MRRSGAGPQPPPVPRLPVLMQEAQMQETNQNSRVLRSKNATAQQQQQVQPGQRSAARSGAAAGARSASDSSGGDDDYEDELHHDVAALNEEDCVDLLGDIENVQPRHGGGYGLPVHQMHAAAGLSGINRDTNGSGSNNSTIQPQRSFLLLGTPSEDQQQAAQAQAQPPNNMGEAIMLEQLKLKTKMVELQIITKETELAKMKRPLPVSDTLLNVGTKKSKKNKNQDKVYTTSDAQGKEVKAEIGKVVTLSLMASSDAPMVYPILGIGETAEQRVKSILAAKLQPLFPSVPAFNSAEEFDNWFDEFGYGIWKDRMKHQQGTRQSEAVKRFCQAHGQLFVDTRASEKSLQPEEKQQRQQFLNFFGSLDERISWLGDDPVGCPKIAFAYVCVYGPKEALIRAGTSITGLRPYQSQADTLYFEAAQYAKLRYAIRMRRNGADISKREEKGVEYALGYCTELMLLRDEVAAKPPQGPFRIKDNLERTEFIDDVVRTEYTKTFGQYVSTFKLTVPETQQEPDAAAALGAADGDDVAADGQPE